MIALLGLLAVAGYQNRDRIGQFLGGILARTETLRIRSSKTVLTPLTATAD